MTKKILLILGGAALAGAIFFGAGYLLDPSPLYRNILSGAQSAPASDSIPLAPFTNIEVDAFAPDIRVEIGTGYGYRYDLPENETAVTADVIGDTFYFATQIDRPWRRFRASHPGALVLTVPADADLDEITLNTRAGSIQVSGLTFTEGEFTTKSGEIELDSLTCDELEAESISDQVSLSNSLIRSLSAKTVSSDLTVSGSFAQAELESTSGDVHLSGAVTEGCEIETVSGGILLDTVPGSLHAKSFGAIYWNGTDQGRQFSLSGGAPYFELNSVSGRITISSQL